MPLLNHHHHDNNSNNKNSSSSPVRGLFSSDRRHRNGRHDKTKSSSHRHNALHPRTRTQKRSPTVKDKISGAMLKIKGTLTRRPREKAEGERRMQGRPKHSRRRRYLGF